MRSGIVDWCGCLVYLYCKRRRVSRRNSKTSTRSYTGEASKTYSGVMDCTERYAYSEGAPHSSTNKGTKQLRHIEEVCSFPVCSPGVSTVCNLASVKDSAPSGWSQLLLGKSLLKAYLEGLWSSVTNDM